MAAVVRVGSAGGFALDTLAGAGHVGLDKAVRQALEAIEILAGGALDGGLTGTLPPQLAIS